MRFRDTPVTARSFILMMFASVCLVLGLSASVVASEEEASSRPDPARIRQLIRELGADEFRIREEAEKGLRSIGIPAYPLLAAAQANEDVEVRLRARYLVDEMRAKGITSGSSPLMSRLLDRFAEKPVEERRILIDYLATYVPYDGVLELSRIAKFEADETLARRASLVLIQACGKYPSDRLKSLFNIENLKLDQNPSDAVQLLQLFADTLSNPRAHVVDWETAIRKYSAENQAANSGKVQANLGDDLVEQLLAAIWIDILRRADESERARALIIESLKSLADDDFHLRWWITFLWDRGEYGQIAKLPDLHPEKVAQSAYYCYCVAAALQEMNESTAARGWVEKAHALIEDIPARLALASTLQNEFGQFEWAEAEYKKVLESVALGSREDLATRIVLALMYHDLARDQEAADVLQKLVDVCNTSAPARRLVEEELPFKELLGRLYHYRAEAARENGNVQEQMEFLNKGLEASPKNIDLLIAMYQIPSPAVDFRAKTMAALAQTKADYESEIATLEKTASAADRQGSLRDFPTRLPTAYNDFAWLVANTEGDLQEALKNSQRSLEYSPAESAYMDTLGRCYFAVGDLENAIKYQRMAIERSPHMAQMQRQLKIFEDASARQQAK